VAILEEQTGIGKNSIYEWDKSNPSVDKVKRVADYFRVTVDELLREED
jgi:transcriptional regulator with XRE-family HTH domain